MPFDLQELSRFVMFTIGDTSVTLGRLGGAVIVLVVATVAANLIALAVRRVRSTATSGRGALYLVEKVAGYALVAIGFIVAFTTLGLDLTALTFFAGAFGLGIGLGFLYSISAFWLSP